MKAARIVRTGFVRQTIGGVASIVEPAAGDATLLALQCDDASRTPTTSDAAASAPARTRRVGPLAELERQLLAVFFPADYPDSVNGEYAKFAGWQAVHYCAASASGMLATSSLLYAVGLGAGAIPTAGAVNWALKDGLGQLGTLAFGRVLAPRFDLQPRAWYFAAAGMLNLAFLAEICTMLVPSSFLALGATANAMKGLCWMTAGSTRAAFNVSFIRRSNISVITAKATSQTIATSLVGTVIGASLTKFADQDPTTTIACFAALATVHLFSAHRGVQQVPLATLNNCRLELLLDARLKPRGAGDELRGEPFVYPSAAEIAKLEAVIPSFGGGPFPRIVCVTSAARIASPSLSRSRSRSQYNRALSHTHTRAHAYAPPSRPHPLARTR